jgi:hypothetical protein
MLWSEVDVSKGSERLEMNWSEADVEEDEISQEEYEAHIFRLYYEAHIFRLYFDT